jgi:hypothetical protein
MKKGKKAQKPEAKTNGALPTAADAALASTAPVAPKTAKIPKTPKTVEIIVKAGTAGTLLPFPKRWPDAGIAIVTLTDMIKTKKSVQVTTKSLYDSLTDEQKKNPPKHLSKKQIRATSTSSLIF